VRLSFIAAAAVDSLRDILPRWRKLVSASSVSAASVVAFSGAAIGLDAFFDGATHVASLLQTDPHLQFAVRNEAALLQYPLLQLLHEPPPPSVEVETTQEEPLLRHLQQLQADAPHDSAPSAGQKRPRSMSCESRGGAGSGTGQGAVAAPQLPFVGLPAHPCLPALLTQFCSDVGECGAVLYPLAYEIALTAYATPLCVSHPPATIAVAAMAFATGSAGELHAMPGARSRLYGFIRDTILGEDELDPSTASAMDELCRCWEANVVAAVRHWLLLLQVPEAAEVAHAARSIAHAWQAGGGW
jgi:hypothetical protein